MIVGELSTARRESERLACLQRPPTRPEAFFKCNHTGLLERLQAVRMNEEKNRSLLGRKLTEEGPEAGSGSLQLIGRLAAGGMRDDCEEQGVVRDLGMNLHSFFLETMPTELLDPGLRRLIGGLPQGLEELLDQSLVVEALSAISGAGDHNGLQVRRALQRELLPDCGSPSRDHRENKDEDHHPHCVG